MSTQQISIVQPYKPPATEGGSKIPVSYATRTSSIFRDGGEPLGDSLEEYMQKTEEIDPKVIFEKTYSTTTMTWGQMFNDFYTSCQSALSELTDAQKRHLKLEYGGLVWNLYEIQSIAMSFIFIAANANNFSLYGIRMKATDSYMHQSNISTSTTFTDITGSAISSAKTLKLYC